MQDSDFQHNFHTHTFRCKHAKGDVADYCEMAISRGMKTLGISDHSALPDDRWLGGRMNYVANSCDGADLSTSTKIV